MLEAIINENIQWKETARQKNIFVRLNSCMIYLRMLLYMNIHIMIFIATKNLSSIHIYRTIELLLQYVYTILFVFLCSW